MLVKIMIDCARMLSRDYKMQGEHLAYPPPLTQSIFYGSQKISGYWKIHFSYCTFHSSILICRTIFHNLYRGQSLQKVLFLSGFYHNTICIAFVFVIRLFVCVCAATTSSPNVYAPVCLLPTSICLHQHRRQRSCVCYRLGSTFSLVSVLYFFGCRFLPLS